MNVFRLAELIDMLSNFGVGLALFIGAGLLAKRSIATASFVAIAAFFQIGGELAQRGGMLVMMRYTANPFVILHLLDIVTLSCLFGALIAGVRALPARAA